MLAPRKILPGWAGKAEPVGKEQKQSGRLKIKKKERGEPKVADWLLLKI